MGEAEARRLAHPQRRVRGAPHFAGQADLAEDAPSIRARPVAQARGERGDDGEVRRRLVDRQAAGDVDEDVVARP